MAKPKHSLARKSDIKAGKTIWIVDLFGIRRVTIKRNEYTDLGYLKTWYFSGSCDMLADSAVIGLAYDARPCQVFTNKKAALWWDTYWKSEEVDNPNFVIKNRHNNQIAGRYCPDFWDHY